MTMRSIYLVVGAAWLGLVSDISPASADSSDSSGARVAVDGLSSGPRYPALTRGRVIVVNAQRLVVAEEPPPVARVSEPPPEPEVEGEESRPRAPNETAIWVAGHWGYTPNGLVWIAGRYIDGRDGHVFVPPRWAEYEEQYLFFTGFFVPYNVYVRSHFNRYYYSGLPKTGSRSPYGPYWPVGAPGGTNRSRTSADARDPYWPVGAPR
jgi:hypothetical protein